MFKYVNGKLVELTKEEQEKVLADQAEFAKQNAVPDIQEEYRTAMRKLEQGYSQEEINTFAAKETAVNDALTNGIENMRTDNYVLILSLAGGVEKMQEKVQNIADAIVVYKSYLGTIERLRDEAIDAILNNEDPRTVVDNLRKSYEDLSNV